MGCHSTAPPPHAWWGLCVYLCLQLLRLQHFSDTMTFIGCIQVSTALTTPGPSASQTSCWKLGWQHTPKQSQNTPECRFGSLAPRSIKAYVQSIHACMYGQFFDLCCLLRILVVHTSFPFFLVDIHAANFDALKIEYGLIANRYNYQFKANKVKVLAEGILSSKTRYLSVLTSEMMKNLTLVNTMVELARRGGTPHPLMFDHVVRCLGWRHQLKIYSDSTTPKMQYNGKYPIMTSEYESINVPGMYFAGQLGHGKDHLKSAGGFIHGFRYTSRALFRMLESKYEQPKLAKEKQALWHAQKSYTDVANWDGAGLGLGYNGCNAGDWTLGDHCENPVVETSPFETLLNRLFSRINTASGTSCCCCCRCRCRCRFWCCCCCCYCCLHSFDILTCSIMMTHIDPKAHTKWFLSLLMA